ncbi:lysophospholipid acyltransferase family protein [Solwaraspora sp. WMMA2056]|uniref:lysophospholipid acyltransferase family protein n=1 Tax=Solwaraspora sp. WMMA2056 TaxID=3015161 RepID=UPI00259BBA45|nr:lysophospholipid acyltransferase family protein [Solwaraspora sp. WMMA2056]WJK40046.1 lysophospholipid acyltransferase family protein [Solwaraspora sp. WMMA2056]
MARRKLGFWRRFVVMVIKPTLTIWTRRDWSGMEHIPRTGGVIIVANHMSHADPMAIAHFVYDAGRWPRFLGKSSLFAIPVVGPWLLKVRQIPVHRGSVDAIKSLEAAIDGVNEGGAVVIYPEGTTSREPDLWPMRGKTGAARLALTTGAPVVPVAMWGPQNMYDPRTRKLNLLPRRPVTLRAAKPIDLSRWMGAEPTRAVLEEMTETIMLRLRDMVAELRGAEAPPLYTPVVRRNGRTVKAPDSTAPEPGQ